MTWYLNINSETLTCIVSHDALRCAKVVLEGKMRKLNSLHANPNCINSYGYFALHEAAERFSVEMIKLLFRHGASANVRTVGDKVIENLLPLHVAIENTCMHKYLEDNLSPPQYHRDYIYKLIHLLCLPEMVRFIPSLHKVLLLMQHDK
jgi:ankyrin repeat protein